jgi:hypothetical protein
MLCPFLLQWAILIGANVFGLHPGADVVAPSEHIRFSAMSDHARWDSMHRIRSVGPHHAFAPQRACIWSYITYRASTRLITDSGPQAVTAIK